MFAAAKLHHAGDCRESFFLCDRAVSVDVGVLLCLLGLGKMVEIWSSGSSSVKACGGRPCGRVERVQTTC